MTADDFWSQVDRTAGASGCWIWRGSTKGDGYGGVQWGGRRQRAHRVAMEIAGHPVPEGLLVRHLCNNPACVNPTHLAPGTHADNMHDMQVAGRGRSRVLSREQAARCREFYGRGLATSEELARLFGVTPQRIRHMWTDGR